MALTGFEGDCYNCGQKVTGQPRTNKPKKGGTWQKKGRKGKVSGNKNLTCNMCGKKGHKAVDC